MQFKQIKIPTNNININTVIKGSGTPLFFIHGWPESFYSWRHQIKFFSKLGYKVIEFQQIWTLHHQSSSNVDSKS